jgi:hypothetical protein
MQQLTCVAIVLSALCIACPADPSPPGDDDGDPGATGTGAASTGPGPGSSSSATTGGEPTTGEPGDPSTGTGPGPTTGGSDESTGTGETTGTDATTGTAATTGGSATGVCAADPCRGDVVGTWTYDSFLCGDIALTTAHDGCEGGMDSTSLWIEGTLEFTGDGSSIVHRRGVQTLRTVIPHTCIFGSCDAVFGGEWTCEDDGVNCDCTAEFYGPWIDEVAPYTVAGHTLHVGDDEIDFCVGDDQLALIHLDLDEWTYLARSE